MTTTQGNSSRCATWRSSSRVWRCQWCSHFSHQWRWPDTRDNHLSLLLLLATHLSQPLVRLTQCELCARPSPVPVSAVVLSTTTIIIVTLSSSYSNLELGLQGLGDLAVEGWYFPLSLRTVLGVGAAGSLMWPLMGAAEAQTRGPGLEAALPLLWHQELLAALASGLGSDSVGASFWI